MKGGEASKGLTLLICTSRWLAAYACTASRLLHQTRIKSLSLSLSYTRACPCQRPCRVRRGVDRGLVRQARVRDSDGLT